MDTFNRTGHQLPWTRILHYGARCHRHQYQLPRFWNQSSGGIRMSIQPAGTVMHRESGMALLGTVLVAALVLGLASWGILNMTKNVQQSVYGESAANQARTAALIGIQAVTGYAQSVYVGNNPSTASLSYLYNASGLSNNDGPVNQSFTQPTNANVQTMITANTFSSVTAVTGSGTTGSISTSSNGYIKMLSTGRSGSAIQTAEAYITAQLSTLKNNKYSVILGGGTLNGGVKNDTTNSPKIYVGITSGVNVNGNQTGNTVQYVPISSLPIINPNGLQQYATISLVNGQITIPASAVGFYINENVLPAGTSTTQNYVCNNPGSCFVATGTTPPSLDSDITYSTLGTWSVNNIPAFIYSNQNVDVNVTGTEQLTVAATGNITTTQNGISLYPFGSLSSSTGTINYCLGSPTLPTCNPSSNPITPYSQVQGIIFVTNGNNQLDGNSSNFYGDLASVGSINVSGTGGDTFAGTTIADGGYSGSNGALKVSNPVAAANSATLGGYQLTPSSIRWVP